MTEDTTVDALRDELAALRAELAAQRAEIASLRAQADGPAGHGAVLEPATDRRGFFKLAAGAAAGAVVATGASAPPAAAATGDALLIGQSGLADDNSDRTTLTSPSFEDLMPVIFAVQNYILANPADPNSSMRVALLASTAGPDGTDGFRVGAYGSVDSQGDPDTRGVGVYASAERGLLTDFEPTEPVGVMGIAGGGGTGVKGHTDSAGTKGVHGRSDHVSAVGVVGENTAGGLGVRAVSSGTALRVEGRLHQVATASAGPPPGAAVLGDQIRDSAGDLFLCTAAGNPGTWRKVPLQHKDFANAGGSINLLAKPIRLIDTRPDSTAPITLGKVRPAVFVDTAAIDVTGVVVGGLSVPDGATGIIGTVTAADALGTGFLSIFPGSTTFPGTSNLNFTAAAPIATAFTCALPANGTIKLRVGSAATHVIIDVAGFLF